MTTPDTAAVRAWARENGYSISDRGRVPAEVKEAYLAAQGKPKAKATAKTAAAKAPVKKAAATKAPAHRTAAKATPAPQSEAPDDAPATEPGSAPLTDPAKQQSGAPEDRRLIALAEQIAALAARVEKLEQAAPSEKLSRFGRRKSR